jgi:hypothetical protein
MVIKILRIRKQSDGLQLDSRLSAFRLLDGVWNVGTALAVTGPVSQVSRGVKTATFGERSDDGAVATDSGVE